MQLKYDTIVLILSMGFWENVDAERDFQNISRKELAYKADFSLTSLSTGIIRNSIPSADVAYRIAKVLNVSIEYLLEGNSEKRNEKTQESNDTFLQELQNPQTRKLVKNYTKLSERDKLLLVSLSNQMTELK